MDDLDELKGRVERATRALSEREAEEQGRHAKLVSLIAALESKSLEARQDKERAEARLAEAEAANEELRGLLGGLLEAVEAGSRSRFADALYALEARISGTSPGPGAPPVGDELADAASEAADDAGGGPSGESPDGGPEAAAAPARPDEEAALDGEEGLDDFTVRLAAGCAVEDELAREAEALRAEAADDAKALLERIRRQVEAPEPEAESEDRPAQAPTAAATADEEGPLAEQPGEADDTLVGDLESGDGEAGPSQADVSAPEADAAVEGTATGDAEPEGPDGDRRTQWDGSRRAAF